MFITLVSVSLLCNGIYTCCTGIRTTIFKSDGLVLVTFKKFLWEMAVSEYVAEVFGKHQHILALQSHKSPLRFLYKLLQGFGKTFKNILEETSLIERNVDQI